VNQELASLAGRYWDGLMESSPTWAGILGDHRFDDGIEDLSREREDEMIVALDGIVATAEAFDPAALDRDDRITRRVLMYEASGQADDLRSRNAEFNVDPMLGIHMNLINFIPQLSATEEGHLDAYVTKASKVRTLIVQSIDRLRQGVANGRTPPRIAVEKSLGQMDAYLASPADQDPFMRIRTPGLASETIEAWKGRMAEQVEAVVRPAMQRYRDMVAAEVLPAARPQEKSGICWLPDGEEVYARAVGRFTSLDLTPQEIHQIGLDEIETLEDEYRELGTRVLGTDDLAGIYDRLRNDPELRFGSPEEIKAHAEAALDRANAASPDWFGRLPEAPCILMEVPEVGAEDAPLAYYLPPAADGSRPGIFFINTTAPTTRTRYESEALSFHEGVPGHHFQLTIAQELEGQPMFRRNGLVTVYVEGWGLYTERLALEMGLYSGDIDRFGILSFDSWRAGRLIVDTGMHALGWSRQQAIDYLADNSPQAPNNIENEVDRYIGWPGQALAYKIGQREIFRLRREAEQTMGGHFDIKGFHDTVLSAGPVPLDLLGDLVREWSAA
jgi:uncharacterized protein (DUF885 family)